MNNKQLYLHVKKIEEEAFSDEIDSSCDQIKSSGGGYTYYAPSWYFYKIPFLSEKEINLLKRPGKNMLSVGAGPAHLERLLVSHFGVPRENIVLADRVSEQLPVGFRTYIFDMHQIWPKMNEAPFNYIIFPESYLPDIEPKENTDYDELIRIRGQNLANVLRHAIPYLKTPGHIRLKPAFKEEVDAMKDSLEKEFSGVKIAYRESGTLLLSKSRSLIK